MSFRRIPFQFTATDPSERQQAIRRQFGLPVTNEMYVDFPNTAGMGSGMKESNSATNSPRLQHRVPIFVEGSDQPIKSSVDTQNNNAQSGRKPRVRVIPIEIEGASKPLRQRTYSGPAGIGVEELLDSGPHQHKEPTFPINKSMYDIPAPQKMKSPSGPRICNIPIQIEGRGNDKGSATAQAKSPKSEFTIKSDGMKINGCNASKNKVKQTEDKPLEPDFNIPLKKIENILSELKTYQAGVKSFVGSAKDKQYRYLDEMLTRCMLNLDDIDTMGNEQVRSARKAAVRNVQACIDLLESKINAAGSSAHSQDSTENISSSNTQGLTSEDVKGSEKHGKTSEELPVKNDPSANEQNKVGHDESITDDEQDVEMEDTSAVKDVPEVDMAESKLPEEEVSNCAQMDVKGISNVEASSSGIKENKVEAISTDVPEVEMIEEKSFLKEMDKLGVEMEECSDNETDNIKVVEEYSMEPVEDNEPTSAGTEMQEKLLKCHTSKPNQSYIEMDVKDIGDAKVSGSDLSINSETSIEDCSIELHSSEDATVCHTSPKQIVPSIVNVNSKDEFVNISGGINEVLVSSSEVLSEPNDCKSLIEDNQAPNNFINQDTNAKI